MCQESFIDHQHSALFAKPIKLLTFCLFVVVVVFSDNLFRVKQKSLKQKNQCFIRISNCAQQFLFLFLFVFYVVYQQMVTV